MHILQLQKGRYEINKVHIYYVQNKQKNQMDKKINIYIQQKKKWNNLHLLSELVALHEKFMQIFRSKSFDWNVCNQIYNEYPSVLHPIY